MASILHIIHSLSLTSCIFILFLISANGRSLHPSLSSANLKLKAVSRAAADSFTTNYTDVLGLDLLATAYPILGLLQLSDDPCVAPVWSWIQCNNDSTPRVIALDISGLYLSGQLPDFSSMDALQRIDLSENALYGTIPSFLGTFPDLQELNLANNHYDGMVPDSLACNNKSKIMK